MIELLVVRLIFMLRTLGNCGNPPAVLSNFGFRNNELGPKRLFLNKFKLDLGNLCLRGM